MNGSQLASYSFDPMHTFPRMVPLDLPQLDAEVQIINGSLNQNNMATSDITSTLTADASIFEGSLVGCENVNTQKEIMIGSIHGIKLYFFNSILVAT